MTRAGRVSFSSPILSVLQVLILGPIPLILILGNEMASLMYSSHIHAAFMTARKLLDESSFHLLPQPALVDDLNASKLVDNGTFHVLPQARRADDFDLLLSVPFYIYEELNWLDTGYRGNKTFHDILRNQAKKHQEDLKFYKAALRHPMRTRRPEEAKLFVVPFLSSIIFASLIYWDPATLCVNSTCGKDLLASMDQFLGESKWFQRNEGTDHLATVTYFGFNHPFVQRRKGYKNLISVMIQWGGGREETQHSQSSGFQDVLCWNKMSIIVSKNIRSGHGCKSAFT
jgi:hypothetical protein